MAPATASSSTVVRVPTSSDVSEVRSFAHAAGRRSLFFFLSNIIGAQGVAQSTADALQRCSATQLLLIAEGIRLWARVRGARGGVPPCEAALWLYSSLRDKEAP
jgi:hypothetical protein